jgi:signal transduction histidine kinase/TPR repeat protein
MKKILSLVSILFYLQNFSFSQNQISIDTLKTQLKYFNAKKAELDVKTLSLYDTTAANILSELASEYWNSNPDTAMYYTNQCLTLSEQIGYKKGIGRAYHSIGVIHYNRSDYLSALDFYEKSLKNGEESGDKKGVARSLNSMGVVYQYMGNYTESLKNYFTALKIFEETGNKKGIGTAYTNIGLVYTKQRNYPSALENHFAALKIFQEIGFIQGILVAYNNIGMAYFDEGTYLDKALDNFFASIKLSEEIGDKRNLANTYGNIGLVYNQQGNYPEALKNHFASLKIREEIGNKEGIATCCRNIGMVKLKMHAAKESKDWLLKGLAIAKEIEAVPHMKDLYSFLSKADSALGNFQGAYENHKLYIACRDSLGNIEKTKTTVTLQMNYDFSKKQDSLNLVQAKKELAAQKELNKNKLIRNTFIAATLIFLLFAGGAILFYIERMQRNRKKQLEEVRARISRDLHDDMGSTLQSISVMSEIVRMKSTSDNKQESIPFIEKIGSASRDMVGKMNDIVWAVNPQNDHFENILLHMRAFGGELLAGKDIALHFKADGSLNDIRLSMEKRRSFFLVYKEALNNTYKYSDAKNVNVEISKTNHTLKLVVEDDGVGFNMNEDRLITGGNGLKNMNTRAAEMNGIVSITSAPGQGTKVSLTVNLSN